MTIEIELKTDDNDWESRTILTVKHNGKLICEEWDGGEPEDQSFYRDWNWVPDMLQKMYNLGKTDAIKEKE